MHTFEIFNFDIDLFSVCACMHARVCVCARTRAWTQVCHIIYMKVGGEYTGVLFIHYM